MPQTFQVLRCFQCLVFQVHPTKKDNKWKCKMCGEKQSMKRFYGLGTGKECRLHVQKLNEIQGEIHNAKISSEDSDESANFPGSMEQDEQDGSVPKAFNKKSKWSDYVEIVEENEQHNPEKTMRLNDTEVLLELPKKRPRKNHLVIKKCSPSSSENKCLKSTRVFNNSQRDKTTESKPHQSLVNPPPENHHKKGVLLPIVRNSKWAQYNEETEDTNDENRSINAQADSQIDPANIFSLFDDDNLDAVLGF